MIRLRQSPVMLRSSESGNDFPVAPNLLNPLHLMIDQQYLGHLCLGMTFQLDRTFSISPSSDDSPNQFSESEWRVSIEATHRSAFNQGNCGLATSQCSFCPYSFQFLPFPSWPKDKESNIHFKFSFQVFFSTVSHSNNHIQSSSHTFSNPIDEYDFDKNAKSKIYKRV